MPDFNPKNIVLATLPSNSAGILRSLLLEEGIQAYISEICIDTYSKSEKLVSVYVDFTDIHRSVKILENLFKEETFKELNSMGMMKKIIIPVDFSNISFNAVASAINIASDRSFHPLLLHVKNLPLHSKRSHYLNSFSKDSDFNKEHYSQKELNYLLATINNEMEKERLPRIPLSTSIVDGIAEEVIIETVRSHNPALIVMATRKNSVREVEGNGSVTAEVLDNTEVPILTLPDGVIDLSKNNKSSIILMASFSRADLEMIDKLSDFFEVSNIIVSSYPEDDDFSRSDDLHEIADYLWMHYPNIEFSYHSFNKENFQNRFSDFINDNEVRLVVVPNKRKNPISRFFNPGIAHRLFYCIDVPMLAIPL